MEEGKELKRQEDPDFEKDANEEVERQLKQEQNKDQRGYKQHKKKALIAAKAIEAGVDASPADKKALDLALSPLTKIRGVDDFSIEPLGPPGKYYVYMIGTKLPVDDFDEGLTSRVKEDPLLLKLAEQTFSGNERLRKEANALIDQLSKGNMNPGIGTKNIGKNIFEARSRGGARVYFRNRNGGIEVVGYSHKGNQTRVINRILEIY